MDRTWRAFSLQPHRVETVKLSTNAQFVEAAIASRIEKPA
jgi:hypothetical protein